MTPTWDLTLVTYGIAQGYGDGVGDGYGTGYARPAVITAGGYAVLLIGDQADRASSAPVLEPHGAPASAPILPAHGAAASAPILPAHATGGSAPVLPTVPVA